MVAVPEYVSPESTKTVGSKYSTVLTVEPLTVRLTVIHISSRSPATFGMEATLSTTALPSLVTASLVESELSNEINPLPLRVVSLIVTTLAAGFATVKSA